MEMPFHLKTLPPEALDILRYFGQQNNLVAHANDIMAATDLGERRFGVALRRLVTKGYLNMDGYQTYRLSDNGRRSVKELADYDLVAPAEAHSARARVVTRRLVLAAPRNLLVGQPTNIFVGFDEPNDEDIIAEPISLLVRLQVLNGSSDMASNKDSALLLENKTARQVFEVSAGNFTKVRLRCFIYQVGNEEDVPEAIGGMYADVHVVNAPELAERTMTAYGVDLQFSVQE
jgi:hypothetical protein